MTSEFVIIIVGALLLLIAIAGSIRLKNSNQSLASLNIRLVLGIIGVLMLIFGGYSYGLLNPQAQIERVDIGNKLILHHPIHQVKITSPVDGDSVQCRILTMGVYPKDVDQDIWVLVRPMNDRYYPQSDHTNTSYKRDGEWQVITRFGGDKGEVYDIIVYTTDAAASAFFSSTIQAWKDALSYPGLDLKEIPAGAVEVDRIRVALKENCRGVF